MIGKFLWMQGHVRVHAWQCLILVLFLAGLKIVLADEEGVSDSKRDKPLANQATKRNIGSAAICRGKILIAEIFLDDAESGWSTAEKTEILRRMDAAIRFVTEQAKRYSKDLQFERMEPLSTHWETLIPVDSTVHPAWTEEVIRSAAGCSAREWTERLRREKAAESTLICLHVDKAALSYNLAYYTSIAEEFRAERMVCFSRYPDGRETADATYAHEILHLFGAGDLYFPYDDTADRKRDAKSRFPNDVMLRVDYDLNQLNVGEFTAFRIGWLETITENLRQFED